MTQLVFLCEQDVATSQMAEGFARRRACKDLTILSAGVRPAEAIHPLTIEVMREVGIDIADQHVESFADINIFAVDVLVTLCPFAQKECALRLPGHPCQVDWNLPALNHIEGQNAGEPASDCAGQLAEFRRVRDMISRLVDDLFDHGYLKALTWANEKATQQKKRHCPGATRSDLLPSAASRASVHFHTTASCSKTAA